VKRTTFFAALACTLLILLGCGTTNHLQTITLSVAGGGLFNLQGEGGTLQLVATGNYSSGNTFDLTNKATYTVTPDGFYLAADGFTEIPLPDPPQTVTINNTGLMTAVDPFVCTWYNNEPDNTKTPKWSIVGSYKVVATFGGITSQPVYVAVASAVVGGQNNGLCGPTN